MRNSRDRERLRAIYRKFARRDADLCKKGADALAGAIAAVGLVQALLMALRASGETGKLMLVVAQDMQDWLVGEHSQCAAFVLKEGEQRWDESWKLDMFIARLIENNDTMKAMALTDEAIRYISQAKLIGGALKGGG